MRALDLLRRFINPPPPPPPVSPARDREVEDRSLAVIDEALQASDEFYKALRAADRLLNPSKQPTSRKSPRARAHP